MFNLKIKDAFDLLKPLCPAPFDAYVEELATYFKEGFGNSTRIDYGSGHELSFLCFCVGLDVLGLLNPEDYGPMGLLVLPTYLSVVRKLQITYCLEPAGSHGVWGLDDFQFIPYYWGSAQLIGTVSRKNFAFKFNDIFLLFFFKKNTNSLL